MNHTHHIPATAAIVFASSLCFFSSGAAGAADGPMQLRVFALSMDPTGDTVFVPDTGERTRFDASFFEFSGSYMNESWLIGDVNRDLSGQSRW